jgi:methionyl-tRNA formyltransferase
LHYITDGTIDTGPIVATARVPVTPGRSLPYHVLSLYPPGADMLVAALEQLSEGRSLSAAPQPTTGARYYSRPSAEEWTAFTRAGWKAVELRDLAEAMRRYLPKYGLSS